MKWTAKLSISFGPIATMHPQHPGVTVARRSMIETLEQILKADSILRRKHESYR